MTAFADYAQFYETEIRPRRRGVKCLGVLFIWGLLFILSPRLALGVWRETH
ncbi:MAG: hypothetical protein JSS35_11620 [Proteobacteria bacterium]|nr:hypothetical protein [Pseudomonadota bacterium]